MKTINYRNLKKGDAIRVVTAWTEDETFADVAAGHFFNTTIEDVYFEPRGEVGYLRIFAKDGDGVTRRVNYVLQDGEVVSAGVVLKLTELTACAGMICLSDRKAEFVQALQRAEKSDLTVYPDWERDTFVVVNGTTGTEYKVKIAADGGLVFASCTCGDFKYRERICKHLGEVLSDTFFGLLVREAPLRTAI